MAHYLFGSRDRQNLSARGIVLPLILAAVVVLGIFAATVFYSVGLRPVSNDQATQLFTVEKGSTVTVIAHDLQQQHLIRSAWAMQRYVDSKHLGVKLQAGTYALSPSQGTISIVKTMTTGSISTKLVTILPGRRIDQVRADFIKVGFSPEEVDHALDPAQYANIPVLALKPTNVNSLEGLLWPDSFQKDRDTTLSSIIKQSLTAMGEHLTPDVQAGFAAQGLNTYQGIILASMVNQEVEPADQSQAAQVFLTRLKDGMVLGSDVTTKYGSIAAGRQSSLTYDSAYNTLLHPGLPPTPVSTLSAAAVQAVAHPAGTDWRYFVAGDDGKTHFSHTFAEHQAATQKYCHKLCN